MSDASPAPSTRKALGFATLTALVVGNMVGSGVFALPASLAPYGGASLIGWVVTALGSMLLGLVFARLGRRAPAAGGPYAYTREAFGEFAAFLVGFGYWVSCWAALATIAVAMVGYLGELVPALHGRAAPSAVVAVAAIVVLAGVNATGVKQAGFVQFATTLLKLLPLVAISVFGWLAFEPSRLEPFNPTGEPLVGVVQGCLPLTLWAFLGLESATIPADDVRDPRRNIPRATVIGVSLAAVLYIASTFAVMGLVPREELAGSAAPFADAAIALWGERAGSIVALGAVVSCFGALNGWTLVASQLPLAIARDGLFPAPFARVSSRGTPVFGLAVSAGLASLLVVANYSGSLVAMFTALVLISTLASLIPLVFCTMAELVLALRARRGGHAEPLVSGIVICTLAFVYGLLAIAGAGRETVFWGLITLLGSIPLYVVSRARNER